MLLAEELALIALDPDSGRSRGCYGRRRGARRIRTRNEIRAVGDEPWS